MEYYDGVFDAVFVLLHPFIKPLSIDPATFAPDSYPDRKAILDNCEPVRWAEVLGLGGFTSIREIDIGLRTWVGGLRSEFANPEYADRLKLTCESHGILPPVEGYFSDLLHNRVLEFIQKLGHEWVWVGDEFCSERKMYWIDDLKDREANATLGHCNVFTPDTRLLWTTHWDSCCSFFCGSKNDLLKLSDDTMFEGFFCTSRTHVYWGVHET